MPTKTTSGRATQHGGNSTLIARRVNGTIERLSKNWSVGKRLRMAQVFTSWAAFLGGAR